MRYQPPLASKDASGQFAELSRVLDAREQPPAFAPSSAAIVQVGAGETKRLAPRAAGQTVILPASDETNYGALVTLLVDSTLGTCKVKPISGTINGAASFTLAAGYQSLLVLMSDGAGRWLTERAEGYPLTNGDKGDITVSGDGDVWTIDDAFLTTLAGDALDYDSGSREIDYVGSTSSITLTGSTGNLGTIDISTLRCGGSLFLSGVAGNWQIEGFTAKPGGFWFNLLAGNTAFTGQLLNDDATATAADRLRLSGYADSAATLAMQAMIFRNGPGARWSCIL